MELQQLFKTNHPVIGVVHLSPLPTSARWQGKLKDVIARAEQEATALAAGGVDGIIIENFFGINCIKIDITINITSQINDYHFCFGI